MGSKKVTGGKKGIPSPRKAQGRKAPKRIEKLFRLEVGKTYETRCGSGLTKIVRKSGDDAWPFEGDFYLDDAAIMRRSYKENGHWLGDGIQNGADLVREAPTPDFATLSEAAYEAADAMETHLRCCDRCCWDNLCAKGTPIVQHYRTKRDAALKALRGPKTRGKK